MTRRVGTRIQKAELSETASSFSLFARAFLLFYLPVYLPLSSSDWSEKLEEKGHRKLKRIEPS
jgi:hypothetical protein